jgi:MFS family permease
MHVSAGSHETSNLPAAEPSWWRTLTGYQWLVFAAALLGWMFDCMDQQIFNLARAPALKELLNFPSSASEKEINEAIGEYGGYATTFFLIGWAIGGVIFGILGDRLGRAKTMVLTILTYSLFTGLSAFAVGPWDFSLYRLLTGLGGGGQFAVGVALVAEVMPERARARALGWLQAAAMVGNMLAAGFAIALGELKAAGVIDSAWRPLFGIGVLPALLSLVVMRRIHEPERWSAVAQSGLEKCGSLTELFGEPRWRKNTLVGMALAFAGVVGLWAIGFFSYDLIFQVFGKTFREQGLSAEVVAGRQGLWMGVASLLLNFGGFWGVLAFSRLTLWTGRKPAFAVAFLAALASTAGTFWFLRDISDIFWMIPIMGFCQMALFGGYAIYLPELFPTRLRSTGTSFCYNVGRLVAAVGPLGLGLLTSQVFKGFDEPMRYAGVTMSAVFLIGLMALPFAPETNGKPLPE